MKEGIASIILARNYPLPLEKLTEHLRLNMLLKLAELNSSKVKSLHITLNFSPSEVLSDEKMQAIAKKYMNGIGFGNQPFIAYRHYDAGHPHLHIVTTNIEITGKRIDLHHLGIRKSEPVRKEIERQFNLVRAEDQVKDFQLKPAYSEKVIYGRSDSRRAIGNVLESLLKKYRYTSLAELNALLKLYNIRADIGQEGSRILRNKGLLYKILDNTGKPIGVPIKASSFYNNPTLKFLEDRYPQNEIERRPFKNHIKKTIDFAFHGKENLSLDHFIECLKKEGIHVVLRQNDLGTIYGLTYVDHKTQCIFNGSALGKDYSAKGILERCRYHAIPDNVVNPIPLTNTSPLIERSDNAVPYGYLQSTSPHLNSLIEEIMNAENGSYAIPFELSGKKKKRRKRKSKS